MQSLQAPCASRCVALRSAGGALPEVFHRVSLRCRAPAQRGALQVRAASISSNDFKPGVFIEVDGAPYRILGASRRRLSLPACPTHCGSATARRGGPGLVRPQKVRTLSPTHVQSTSTSSPAKALRSCAPS